MRRSLQENGRVVDADAGVTTTAELGPVVAGLRVTGRAGSAITAEIGAMKATEQLDGLRMMAIDPIHFVAMPRALALTLAMPLLNGLFIVFAIAGAYSVGVDCSFGTSATPSCISIFDKKIGEQVGEWLSGGVNPMDLSQTAIAICKWFWDAYIIWETNGSGRAFGDAMIEWEYGRYYKRAAKTETGETGANAGWAPTRDNKYQLLSQYRGSLADRAACNRCEEAMRESLEYLFSGNNWVEHSCLNENEDPSGARDQHGDRVIADALAVKVMNDQPKQVTQVEQNYSPLSVAGRRKLRKSEEKQGGSNFKF